MPLPAFHFKAFPNELYGYGDLFGDFDPETPASYRDMPDTLIYKDFIARGGAACGNYLVAMGRALHDNGITMALAEAVENKKVVAMLGGHSCRRDDPIYAAAARLSAKLTAAGFTMVSGGGPGVMEATHLGAAFAGDEAGLEDALRLLADPSVPQSVPPDAGDLIKDGDVQPAIAEKLGAFLAPAVRIRKALGDGGGIAIPTWLYGHEPTTPFAGKIAKYFQNSIREDGLLALATGGAIYMPGSAGTLQEIFQDTTQNFYQIYPAGPGKVGEFSPMIFFGEHWEKDLPLKAMLDALFGETAPEDVQQKYQDWVRFLSDVDGALAHIIAFDKQTSSTGAAMALFRDTRG